MTEPFHRVGNSFYGRKPVELANAYARRNTGTAHDQFIAVSNKIARLEHELSVCDPANLHRQKKLRELICRDQIIARELSLRASAYYGD